MSFLGENSELVMTRIPMLAWHCHDLLLMPENVLFVVKSCERKRSPVRAPGLSVLEMTLSVRGDFTASSTHATVPPCLEAARASKSISCPILPLRKTPKLRKNTKTKLTDAPNHLFNLQIYPNPQKYNHNARKRAAGQGPLPGQGRRLHHPR